MSPDKQRIAIAEALGYIVRNVTGDFIWIEMPPLRGMTLAPNYPEDLHAAFVAMRHFRDNVLSKRQWDEFGWLLAKELVGCNISSVYYGGDFADFTGGLTPQVICECLLRASKKWEDER